MPEWRADQPSRKIAYKFYGTPAWRNCSKAYKKSVGGLCEKCKAKGLIVPGEIVHHKIELTAENIDDPSITLSWSNLELVCRSCHSEVHGFTKRRYVVDEMGRVMGRDLHSPL